ncbi:MAG: hypothetical protein ACT4TC_07520 [Myxococcaceae bacterium]
MAKVDPNRSIPISQILIEQKRVLAAKIDARSARPDGRISIAEIRASPELSEVRWGKLFEDDFQAAYAIESDILNPAIEHDPTKLGYFKGVWERANDQWDD